MFSIKWSTITLCLFMFISWFLGLYFLAFLATPSIIIPLGNQYIWVTPFVGLLSLTIFLTAITIVLSLLRKKANGRKRAILPFLHSILWLVVLLSQVKVILFNLGICH
ncbi:polyferredoxin [Oikeobacillus pervagus]|uniref:Polyferredoxin n=1 Tax=Oikeobacillus pervagus TaxID=1325931 RepID=A0AAJ1WK47_9BACI|nr:hypothetical protein [Oikeobacillus pervagus]MDQ0216360.1 polyferredoxin [Oikeobacillus pervagus]